MSASIHSLVADYLNISDEKAKKLLAAMLREVKKRAHTKGVRLPEFGTFRGRDGRLVFEPSESLARSVNRRFEGLESEDLASAPQEQSKEKTDDGPSTITLGYQDSSNWSPLDSEETSAEAKEPTGNEESEPDTAEFEVPSADQAADTSELQAQDPTPSPSQPSHGSSQDQHPEPTKRSGTNGSRSEPDRTERSRESTGGRPERKSGAPSDADSTPNAREEAQDADSNEKSDDLYPLVEDESGAPSNSDRSSSSRDQSINEAERQSLSDIWHSDTMGEVSSGGDDSEEDTSAATERFAAAEEESAQRQEEDLWDEEPEPAVPEDHSTPKDTATAKDEGSSSARVFVTLLVLFLLGGAAWYILGQRGMVQPPRTTLSNLNAQIQPLVRTLPVVGSKSQSSGSTAQTDPATPETASSESESPSTAENEAETSSSDPGASQAESSTASSSINPDAGGFTIIVASRTSEGGAQSVRDTYRQRFAGEGLAIDVIPSTVNNTRRYRIGVGQYDTRSEAQEVLTKFDSNLPDGAWILGL